MGKVEKNYRLMLDVATTNKDLVSINIFIGCFIFWLHKETKSILKFPVVRFLWSVSNGFPK